MEEPVVVMIGLLIRTIVGGLIGKKRKVGAGWGALLGAVLGIIGWIIAACSGKTDKIHYQDMSKGGGAQ